MRSAPAIGFELRPSRLLLVATVSMTALALLAIVACAAPAWLKLVLCALVLAGAGSAIRSLRDPSYRHISHDQTGWQIGARDGSIIAVELRQHARLGAMLVLEFQLSVGRWRCLIAPDMVDADTRRRLLLTLASLHDPAADRRPAA